MASTHYFRGETTTSWPKGDKPNPGRIRLICEDPPLKIGVLLGPELPQTSGGFGGWEVTGRPRAVAMTTWNGVDPFEFTLPILLDGGPDRESIEPIIADIIDVARGTDRSPPGILRITGLPGLPANRWVITGISFDDARRRRNMHRWRQLMTLTLLEYSPPDYDTIRKGALMKPRPKTVVYKTKKGDTPARIARGRRCSWTDIRDLNRKGLIKRANQHLKPGMRLMVPVKHATHHKKKKHHRRG